MIIALGNIAPIAIVGIIIGVFGVIALTAFLIYRHFNPKMKDENVVDEKQALSEELNRVLEPIEDDKLADQVANYKEEDE